MNLSLSSICLNMLINAARNNDYNKAKLILYFNKNLDINHTNSNGECALICAIRGNNIQLVNLLLAWGADVNVQDKCRYTPLTMASSRKLTYEMLYQNYDMVNWRKQRCNRSHFKHYYRNNYAIIKVLLECGADIDEQIVAGISPLTYAVRAKNINSIRKLMQYGVKCKI